jgi:hypothetical protein
MRLTVIIDTEGHIIGTMRGPHTGVPAEENEAGVSAGLLLEDGQRLQEIDVPDDFRDIEDANELHEQVRGLMSS